MPRRAKFGLIFAPETLEHLDAINRKYHCLIQKMIDEQLSSTPERVTRNRKPLEEPAPFGAAWELRFGPNNRFRVFYETDTDRHFVRVLAIGVKERNKLFVSGKEFEP